MHAIRNAIIISLFVMLCGCSTTAATPDKNANFQNNYDPCGFDFEPGGPSKDISMAELPVVAIEEYSDMLVYAGCSGIEYLVQHTIAVPSDVIHDGLYSSPDGLFTIAVPDDYSFSGNTGVRVRQQIDKYKTHLDYVFFMPTSDRDLMYTVGASSKLPKELADGNIDDLVHKLAVGVTPITQTMITRNRQPLSWQTLAYTERLSLDGKPAVLRVLGPDYDYVRKKATDYYLVYIVKQGDHAAMLTIRWLGECPKCASGPEADIRAMDLRLAHLVSTFHLGN